MIKETELAFSPGTGLFETTRAEYSGGEEVLEGEGENEGGQKRALLSGICNG